MKKMLKWLTVGSLILGLGGACGFYFSGKGKVVPVIVAENRNTDSVGQTIAGNTTAEKAVSVPAAVTPIADPAAQGTNDGTVISFSLAPRFSDKLSPDAKPKS